MKTSHSFSLSVCIPTYNFGAFIKEALESIVSQLTDDVEIIVLDGASTDNTSDIVGQFQKKYPNFVYCRLEKKGGIDYDMAKTVELAHGEYCWLFSADDVMKAGAIEKVLNQIKSGHDLFLCKHMNCSLHMKILNEHPVLRTNKEVEFNLTDSLDRRQYFQLAQTTEAFFSFAGGIIIKKSKWDSVPINEAFVGSCWAHVARIFDVLPNGLSLKYIPEPLLDRRGDNDSFSDKGIVNRYRIGIEGYHKIGDVFFGHESFEAYHIRRVVRNEFTLKTFLRAKLYCLKNPSREDRTLLNVLFRKVYQDTPLRFIIIYLIYQSVPQWLLSIMKRMRYKSYLKP